MCGRWNLGRGLLRAMPGRGARFAFSVDSASRAGPGPSVLLHTIFLKVAELEAWDVRGVWMGRWAEQGPASWT